VFSVFIVVGLFYALFFVLQFFFEIVVCNSFSMCMRMRMRMRMLSQLLLLLSSFLSSALVIIYNCLVFLDSSSLRGDSA